MPVDGGIGHHHGVLLGGIGAPLLVLVDEPVDVLAPYGAVQRANHRDLQLGGFLQQRLYLGAVLADDVGVVAAGVIQAFRLEVDLVGEDIAVKRAEGAEGIGREKNPVRGVVADHGLGPMHHGRHHKGKGVLPGAQGIHLLDNGDAIVDVEGEVVLDHRLCLGVGVDLHIGIAQHQLAHCGAVFRLHVVDHQIIQRFAGVEQHGLLVQHQIGIVGNAVRDGVDVLKQRQATVAAAHPVHILCDLLYAMHDIAPPSAGEMILASDTGKHFDTLIIA